MEDGQESLGSGQERDGTATPRHLDGGEGESEEAGLRGGEETRQLRAEAAPRARAEAAAMQPGRRRYARQGAPPGPKRKAEGPQRLQGRAGLAASPEE